MYVAFGKRKCPLCGDFGRKIHEEIFTCIKCNIVFNNYSVHVGKNRLSDEELEAHWN